jgi:hypothetical protein
MAIGALIGAYQEDDSGGLRALLPLAGRTLLEYQARCAAAAGAAPIVVIVERVPQALQDALERMRLDGLAIVAISTLEEAVTRFEAGSLILLIGDGIAPPAQVVADLAEEPEAAVATVTDDEMHEAFERIDGQSRWAGVALIDAKILGSTAAMIGDWDLQSTLLRRTLQEGARRIAVAAGGGEPLLVERPEQLEAFQRTLVAASRGARGDWASRFLLPLVEEFATEQLMETAVRPSWLIWTALGLTLGGALCFLWGWPIAGIVLLLLSTPLDLVAARLASLRLRPLPVRMWSRFALWPGAGLALAALGWWDMRLGGGEWGALLAAVVTAAFAEAARIEKAAMPPGGELWLFSRRNAIFAAIPFVPFGAWTAYLLGLLAYAAISFFIVQHVRHSHSS